MAQQRAVARDLGPVGSVSAATWRSQLGLDDGETPIAVIVEGTWWREQRTQRRLAGLADPRELDIPGIFLGRWQEDLLLYACPYGAPATAEIVHIAALVGARLAIQIGSCGIVAAEVRPGDVVVPTEALGLDGVTRLYAAGERAMASVDPSSQAAMALGDTGVRVHRGPSVTWPTLFNQPTDSVRTWQSEGYLGVDMETATTLAVAQHFGVDSVSMLVAWDEVLSGRSFVDPLSASDQAAFDRAEEAVWDVALSLVAAQPVP